MTKDISKKLLNFYDIEDGTYFNFNVNKKNKSKYGKIPTELISNLNIDLSRLKYENVRKGIKWKNNSYNSDIFMGTFLSGVIGGVIYTSHAIPVLGETLLTVAGAGVLKLLYDVVPKKQKSRKEFEKLYFPAKINSK